MDTIQKVQACRFLLERHGLMGARRFRGSEGVLDYVRQVGCVQYDPVDACGKSHELALLARVHGFSKPMLESLLYDRRVLIDAFDKNMCLMLTQDWPCMAFVRRGFQQHTRSSEAVEPLIPDVLKLVHERGCLSAQELNLPQKTDWYWSAASLGRAALETLYFRGELVIHHKTGTVKSYALARDCLPRALLEAPDPFPTAADRQRWQVKRRIGAVGLLWNAPSDAWLGVEGLTAQAREEAFGALEREGAITPVRVEGITRPLYLLCEELDRLRDCAMPMEKQARLLAPLDCLLWDRRLISVLFGYLYKWEIYTPEAQRRYGYYVLPVIYGDRFAGRVEPLCDRHEGVLRVKRFWPEADFHVTNRFLWALEDELQLLCRFQGLERIVWEEGWLLS